MSVNAQTHPPSLIRTPMPRTVEIDLSLIPKRMKCKQPINSKGNLNPKKIFMNES